MQDHRELLIESRDGIGRHAKVHADRNGAHRRSLVLLALCIAMAFGCHGPVEPAPLRRPPEPSGSAAASPVQRASQLAAERELDELRRLLEIDRRACEAGEQTVANLRSLHMAGRVSQAELGVAEADLLRLLYALRLREQELADALVEASVPRARDGSASGAPRRPSDPQ